MSRPNVSANRGQMGYNNPVWAVSGGNVVQQNKPDVKEQVNLHQLLKQVMIDMRDYRYFSQLSGVYKISKNTGKIIKKMHQFPLLDARNVNNQGIDSLGNGYQNAANLGNPNGNLYGSSLDVNTMTDAMPYLSEVGGRVNRVGFTQEVISGTLSKMGFYYEFTNELITYTDDPSLLKHMAEEALQGAFNIQEDTIALELLNAAGHRYYTGSAVSLETITGEGASISKINHKDLQRLAISLKEAKAPHQLAASTGSTIVDSKIVGAGYPLYIHYDLENQFREMTDSYGNVVFTPVAHYANGTNTLHGEIGTIDQFRIISVPRMPKYAGAGAEDTADASLYRVSPGRAVGGYGTNIDPTKNYYDVYPVMCVASQSFTCLGFQAGLKLSESNFKMITKFPSAETANAQDDPYGTSGFTSIQWDHGMLVSRPEWIAVSLTIAEL